MKPLLVFHAADLHYCPKHLYWVDKAFSFAVQRAIDAGAQLAVIAGDSFDSSMGIHEPAVSAYLRQILILADAMPVVVLQGTYSHDRPGSLDFLKGLPTKHRVEVADEPGQLALVVDDRGSWFGPADEEGAIGSASAVISILPSLNRASPEVMAAGPNQYAANVLSGFAAINGVARTAGVPTILTTHGTVNGSRTESGYAMVSPDHEFDEAALYAAGADVVMMGHIHAHQWFESQGQIIAYPGSIARLVHGHHDPVGALLWQIESGSPSFERIETPSRQLLEIEFDGPPNMDELAELATQADADTHVRIRWSVDQEHAGSVDKQEIRRLFEAAGAVKLEGTINAIQSVRAAGIGKAMTLEEKLGYYATTTGDEGKLPALTQRLGMLQTMDIDRIVADVVDEGQEDRRKAA